VSLFLPPARSHVFTSLTSSKSRHLQHRRQGPRVARNHMTDQWKSRIAPVSSLVAQTSIGTQSPNLLASGIFFFSRWSSFRRRLSTSLSRSLPFMPLNFSTSALSFTSLRLRKKGFLP